MKPFLPFLLASAPLALAPAAVIAGNSETEPNDTKAQANVFSLPVASAPAFITGNSTGSVGSGLDYYRLTTAEHVTAAFYRHRLIIQSATPGHTGTLRGLTQLNGVIERAQQGANHHTGKATETRTAPKKDDAVRLRQAELNRLRKELARAVEDESYERAAQLRDQIRTLENA